ncbi:MAG: type II toxin-antitoxin system HicB family antitoxin [Dehalococcoidia bacterium]
MRRYSVVLVPEVDEGGFSVKVPLLPGCVTQGDTVEEALDNARDAIELYLESLSKLGEEIPEEREPLQLHIVDANPNLPAAKRVPV